MHSRSGLVATKCQAVIFRFGFALKPNGRFHSVFGNENVVGQDDRYANACRTRLATPSPSSP